MKVLHTQDTIIATLATIFWQPGRENSVIFRDIFKLRDVKTAMFSWDLYSNNCYFLGEGAAPGAPKGGKGGNGAAEGLGGKGKAGGKDAAAGGKDAAAGGKEPAEGGKEAAAGGKEAGEHTPAEANRLSQHKCL
jgi:hypothetical protein